MVSEGLARKVTAHGIADLAMPDPLAMVARVMLDVVIVVPVMLVRRNAVQAMRVLHDGGQKAAMLALGTLVRRHVALGTPVRHRVAGDRTGLVRMAGMVVREVNAVRKVDPNMVREDLRLAVPDRIIVVRLLVRREVPKADAVLSSIGESMAGRHGEVMIVLEDSVVRRHLLDEAGLVVLRRS